MTRSGQVCGYDLQQGFANCEHVSMCFAKFIASNRSMVAYDLCMEHYVHANLHDMHAGMWNCAVDWGGFFKQNKDWIDPTLFSILAVKMVSMSKSFVSMGWLSCPTSCDTATQDFETCKCTSSIAGVTDVADVDSLTSDEVNYFVRTMY
jgi:hypothetical protein